MNDSFITQTKYRLTGYEAAKAAARKERLGVFLVFSALAVTGMEYFYQSQNYVFVAFIFSFVAFVASGEKVSRDLAPVILLFLVVEIFQAVLFGGFSFRTFAGTYIRLLLAYFVVRLTGKNFYRYYVRIMYFFSVVSLVFYAGSFLPGAENFYVNTLANLVPNPWAETEGFYQNKPNVLVFAFEQTLFSANRNAGPFWEPGGFGVFLMVALLFNHINDNTLINKKNIVFIICIITTLSTTTYLCLFIFLVYINFNKLKRNNLYLILIPAVIAGSFVLYERIPFLKEKVVKNIISAEETTSSRFGSALADFKDFLKSPIVGFGRSGAKQDFMNEKFFGVEQHRNNGVFNLMVTYGSIITIVYLVRIFRTFVSIKNNYSLHHYFPLFSFIIILLLGFSQGIFMRPFFYCFLFLPFIFERRAR